MKSKFFSKLICFVIVFTTVLSCSSVVFAKKTGLSAEQRALRDSFGKANPLEMTLSEMALAIGDYIMEYFTYLTKEEVTVERIIFNKVDVVNANFFVEMENSSPAQSSRFMRDIINGWYSLLGQVAMIVFLACLAVVGIMIMLGGAGTKAKAQDVLMKWIMGIIIFFFFPYVMKYAFVLNEAIIQMIQNTFNGGSSLMNSYIGGISDLRNTDVEFRSPMYVTAGSYVLMLGSEEATAAYINRLETYKSKGDLMRMMRALSGITAKLIYVILWFIMLFQLGVFLYIYYKRYLIIAFLIMIFPVTLIEYIIGTLTTGKQSALSSWSKEFFVNVFLQSIHAVVYGVISGVVMSQLLAAMETGDPNKINWFLMICSTNFVFAGEKALRGIINAMATETVKTGEDVTNSVKGGLDKAKGAAGMVMGGLKGGK